MIVLPSPRCPTRTDERAGFTLIEVALAVLVIGLGLLTVFSLFPSGLRSAEEGAADTHAGLFAETVLNGLRGNASTVTNWDTWSNDFWSNIRDNVLETEPMDTGVVKEAPFGGQTNRYRLTLRVSDPNQYGAVLEFWDGQYGPISKPSVFYTEFTYQGM